MQESLDFWHPLDPPLDPPKNILRKRTYVQKGINKIFTCGAQWTWDMACDQHVHAYISKTDRLKLNLHLRCVTDMGYDMWPTCPCV